MINMNNCKDCRWWTLPISPKLYGRCRATSSKLGWKTKGSFLFTQPIFGCTLFELPPASSSSQDDPPSPHTLSSLDARISALEKALPTPTKPTAPDCNGDPISVGDRVLCVKESTCGYCGKPGTTYEVLGICGEQLRFVEHQDTPDSRRFLNVTKYWSASCPW